MSSEKSQGTGGSAGAGPLTETPSKGVSQADKPSVSSGSKGITSASTPPPRTPPTPLSGSSSSGPAGSTRPLTTDGVSAPRRPEPGLRPAVSGPLGSSAAGAGPGAGQAPRPSSPPRPTTTMPRDHEPPLSSSDDDGVRTVRLTVANVDPMSVLKLSFLVAVACGIVLVTAVAVLWMLLDWMGVFTDINNLVGDIGGKETKLDIYSYIGLGKVLSISIIVAIVNVFIITALSTIGAFLYNFGSGLVGGLQVTLSDD